MTAREAERLAKMEQRQEDMAQDISEIKDTLKKFVEDQDLKQESLAKKFVTRAEALAFGLALSVVVTAVTLWMNLKEHIN